MRSKHHAGRGPAPGGGLRRGRGIGGSLARHRWTRAAALAFAAWCLVVPAAVDVGAQDEGVFSAVDPDAARGVRPGADESGTTVPRTIRSRLVRIDLQALDGARAAVDGAAVDGAAVPAVAATLTLNVFEDAVFRARVERSSPTSSGYVLTGRLEDVPFGTMALVVNGPVVTGTVRTPDATWRIRSAGAGLYVIREVDLSTLPPGAEPLVPSPDDPRVPPPAVARADFESVARAGADFESVARVGADLESIADARADLESIADASADVEATDDDGSVIDVLVVYTPAARDAEGGTAQIQALVDLWVAETNRAYADSGVVQRIALVGREEVDYVESGDTIADLGHLRHPRDGHMDEVHDIRDAYAADVVNLIYQRPPEDPYCGAAYLMLSVGQGHSTFAFGTAGADCGARTFAHELGHVMGLRHDRYVTPDEERPYPYSAGYVNQRAFEAGAPDSSRWRTIMAYNRQCSNAGFGCQYLLRFSNPDQSFRGDRLGVPGDSPSAAVDGPADARRSLNNTRSVVAGFRSSRDRAACKPALRPDRQFVTAAGGTFEVSVTIHSECAWTATPDEAFVSVTRGSSGTGSGVVEYRVSANSGSARPGRLNVSGGSILIEQVGPVNEGICGRTLAVHQEIVRTSGAEYCWTVTSADLSGISWLNLIGQRITALKADDFSGLSRMRQLSLSRNDLTALPTRIFAGLFNLRSLELYENGLTALPENAFAGLSSLVQLGLGGNNLTTLQGGTFTGLSSLERLYLHNNDLATLPENIFAGLSSLKQLLLSGNELRALPEGIFAGLYSLEGLFFTHNDLTTLPEGLFAGLDRLQELWIQDNRLTALPERVFRGLSNLEGLIFQFNDLTTLPEGLFAGLDRLQLLWMGANRLTALPERVFRGLSSLDNLGLSVNPLGSVPERLFEGLSRLRVLFLTKAELTALPPGVFAGLTALKTLWLYQNELHSLPAGVFTGLSGFTNLELYDNPGSPFTLTLRPVRAGQPILDEAVAVQVAEGAPFDMVVPLSATGATLSPRAAMIGAGHTASARVAVTRHVRTATVQPGPPPAIPRGSGCGLPRCITGLRLATEGVVVFSGPVPFTDNPLRPGVTPVKATHFLELRERIDKLRDGEGLPSFPWTDPMLTPRVTPVRRVHLAELREALTEVYAAAGRPAPTYTDPALPAETVIRAAHLMELRRAVWALE